MILILLLRDDSIGLLDLPPEFQSQNSFSQDTMSQDNGTKQSLPENQVESAKSKSEKTEGGEKITSDKTDPEPDVNVNGADQSKASASKSDNEQTESSVKLSTSSRLTRSNSIEVKPNMKSSPVKKDPKAGSPPTEGEASDALEKEPKSSTPESSPTGVESTQESVEATSQEESEKDKLSETDSKGLDSSSVASPVRRRKSTSPKKKTPVVSKRRVSAVTRFTRSNSVELKGKSPVKNGVNGSLSVPQVKGKSPAKTGQAFNLPTVNQDLFASRLVKADFLHRSLIVKK